MFPTSIWNIGPPTKFNNTRLCKRMENEEGAHYQKELDDVKNNMTQVTSLLEQLLRAQSREGTSS
jgi:hypothetical protein